MKSINRIVAVLASTGGLCVAAQAQIPDLLNTLDAGGRALGMGGANNTTNVDTLSSYYNPAALGYLGQREVGLTFRNLPTSRTQLSGTRSNPDLDTDGQAGSRKLSHFGFATPVKDLIGRGSGTVGFAYTIGGYIDDTATASTLSDGALTLSNYELRRKAQADFYTLSYGKANAKGNFSYGIGLVYAEQKVEYSETANAFDNTNSPVPFSGTAASSTGNGFGVTVGALYTPTAMPNLTLGLSYRSEINLTGNTSTASELDKIPARLLFGATVRKDGFRGDKDFLLLGAQIGQYFGEANSTFFDRSSQTTYGVGAEYNLGVSSGRVPLRVGFSSLNGGGDFFGRRNTFTFGVGYRPDRVPVGLDFNWAVPQGGGYDFSIAASYRFK